MTNTFARLGSIVALLLFIACDKEEAGTVFVDSRLVPYFTSFQKEAVTRGVMIDLTQSKIAGEIMPFEEQTEASAQCVQPAEEGHYIRIEENYWSGLSELKKEFIVFHELGHCVLDRRHLDDQDEAGRCLSMMHSGSTSCKNEYNSDTRNSYLDELFNH